LLPEEKLKELYPDTPMCLYGEGYGARIKKGGGKYTPDGADFVLFDVWIDGWWLRRKDIEDVASKLGIEVVPIIGEGVIQAAVDLAKGGFQSKWGDFRAEGLVLKPAVELKTRAGDRVITKMKYEDFKR